MCRVVRGAPWRRGNDSGERVGGLAGSSGMSGEGQGVRHVTALTGLAAVGPMALVKQLREHADAAF
jgi:hypothetical protein